MEAAVALRGGAHPALVSAHHWSRTTAHERQHVDALPIDPRNWSRTDVGSWLRCLAARHGIPPPPAERFPMNGKALCLMSVDMYLHRVPLGGKLLYRDFQIRLAKAMHM